MTVATGFLMIGTKMLSERDKEKLTMDVIDEQINSVGQAFMGLTLGCARCHDHKFDPIPTGDYYALAGIFRSTETLKGESQKYVSTWPKRNLPALATHRSAVAEYETRHSELISALKDTQARRESVAEKIAGHKIPGIVIDDVDAKVVGTWKKSKLSSPFIGEGYIHDNKENKGEKSIEYSFAVAEDALYELQLSYTHGSSRAKSVPILVKHSEGETATILDQREIPTIDNTFASIGVYRFEKKTQGSVTVSTRGTKGFVIGDALRLVQLDAQRKPIQTTNDSQAAKEELEQLNAQLGPLDVEVKERKTELSELEQRKPLPLPTGFVVADGPAVGDTEIRVRGEHKNIGPSIPRGVIQVATTAARPTFSNSSSGRLELANWLADPMHPLTARVYVNRVWHHLIGSGIVASVDNFGKLGDVPSHPQLLDYLAFDFVEQGWSTKKLVRTIVLSRTYRMSTTYRADAWHRDPDNRLLWRANRRRLTAESIRDSMMSISGQLDWSDGTSPVLGLGTLVTQNSADEANFNPQETMQRSAFLPMIRSEIPPILAVFDFADPDLVTGRRASTTVPAQALLLLNSPFVMKQAEAAANRIESMTADRHGQIILSYQFTFCRLPTAIEIGRAEEFLKMANAGDDNMPPLAQMIQMLFAATEFRTLD